MKNLHNFLALLLLCIAVHNNASAAAQAQVKTKFTAFGTEFDLANVTTIRKRNENIDGVDYIAELPPHNDLVCSHLNIYTYEPTTGKPMGIAFYTFKIRQAIPNPTEELPYLEELIKVPNAIAMFNLIKRSYEAQQAALRKKDDGKKREQH